MPRDEGRGRGLPEFAVPFRRVGGVRPQVDELPEALEQGDPHPTVDAEKKQRAHPRAPKQAPHHKVHHCARRAGNPAGAMVIRNSSTAGPWSLNYAMLVTSVAKSMAKGGLVNADLSGNDREAGAARF